MTVNSFLVKANKRKIKQSEIEETDIEEIYCKYAKHRGCIAYKLVFLSRRGFPDRTTLCRGGRILFIEFKRKGKGLTSLQEKVMKIIIDFGFEYYICDEIGQAENHLNKLLSD